MGNRIIRYLVPIAACVLLAFVAQAQAIPSYEELKAHYDYDQDMPLDLEAKTVRETAGYKIEHLGFSSTNDERVTALVEVPTGDGPFPAVMLLHGYGGSKDDFGRAGMLDVMGAQGLAVIAIDAEFHGERREPETDIFDASDWERGRGGLMQTVTDCRRAVDALLTYPQIDPDRVGYIGLSMGAILGSVFCAVEPRISCAVLVVGGADWGLIFEKSEIDVAVRARESGLVDPDALRELMAPVDPLHFVAHISPRPVLFQAGRQDNIVPVEACELLIDTAGEPKEVDWYDAGHMLPVDKVLLRINGWLREKLGL